MVYCWSYDMPQMQIQHEAVVAKKRVIDWCNYMREECGTWLECNATKICGIDINGEPIIVEIDETKYFHKKYHHGQWRDGHWVFGGIKRGSAKCFLLEVPDRRADMLQACIEAHILPWTHIVSNGWAAYAHIDQIGHRIYKHSVVVHERNFVDPDDSEVHTQNIENTWMIVKRKLKRQFGTSRALFPSYLQEFAYCNQFRCTDMFPNFLMTLVDNYP